MSELLKAAERELSFLKDDRERYRLQCKAYENMAEKATSGIERLEASLAEANATIQACQDVMVKAYDRLKRWCDLWKPEPPGKDHWCAQARDILAKALGKEADDGTTEPR